MKLFICQVYSLDVVTGEGEYIVVAPEIGEWHINKCIDFKYNELQMEIKLVHNIQGISYRVSPKGGTADFQYFAIP